MFGNNMFGGGAPRFGSMFRGGPQSGFSAGGIGDWWKKLGAGEGGANNQAMLILGALGGIGNYFGQKGQVDVQRDRLNEEKRQYDDTKKEQERRRQMWQEWLARNGGMG